jgi:hypothetical protein
MSAFARCACGGFVVAARPSCPHCGAPRAPHAPRAISGVRRGLGLVGGATIAFTLMACYGRPPCRGEACKEVDSAGAESGATPAPSGDTGGDAR